MDWHAFWPDNDLLIALVVFGVFKFELQRWTHQIQGGGPRGASEAFMAIVTFTSAISSVVGLVGWGLIFWYLGWQTAIGSFVVAGGIGLFVSGAIAPLIWGDGLLVRLVSLIAVWPAGAYLIYTIVGIPATS